MLDDAREKTVSQTGNGEPDTKEAEALAAALNHSAERAQTLWFSFLTVMLYLTIATGTTTHRMLFLESPLNLPVLNIPLPLFAFYILTPLIFIVFHFYMLLNLVLLARTAKTFEDALVRAFPEDGEARETFRMRIENTLFVQLLVGGRLERQGINAKFLSLMALISLALAPVALMLMFEIKFLPYHSEKITWWHRGLLALDLALVWTLWPGYRSGWGVLSWPKWNWRWPRILSALTLIYAVAAATFPDEQMYLATHGLGIAPTNILVLTDEDLIDDDKLKKIVEKNEISTVQNVTSAKRWVASLSLAERDLTGANLVGADIRHVDFSGAILNRANLGSAWVQNARFNCVGAVESKGCTQLQGASLDDAQLQGAEFWSAQLQGASLVDAQLWGASLIAAQLQGARLDRARLQGSWLSFARLQGASFVGTQLQGADLYRAELQGAFLYGARLQGTLLNEAQLQGASLVYPSLEGASFASAFVWRADARKAIWQDALVISPEIRGQIPCWMDGKKAACDWTAAAYDRLKREIVEKIPDSSRRLFALDKISERLNPNSSLEEEEKMARVWTDRAKSPVVRADFEKAAAKAWQEIGCDAKGAPYVVQSLLARIVYDPNHIDGDLLFASDSVEKSHLAAAFLATEICPGARGLSQDEIAALKKIRDASPPQAPKP